MAQTECKANPARQALERASSINGPGGVHPDLPNIVCRVSGGAETIAQRPRCLHVAGTTRTCLRDASDGHTSSLSQMLTVAVQHGFTVCPCIQCFPEEGHAKPVAVSCMHRHARIYRPVE
jgi:hypothetical protein